MGRKSNTDPAATLTPLMFQILVALSQGERHGYAIMQEIEERTEGEFSIGAGSLYRSIKQLLRAGFVEDIEKEHVRSQRRYYKITKIGKQRAAADARVFAEMVAWANDAELLDT